jgi:hypothetical protein
MSLCKRRKGTYCSMCQIDPFLGLLRNLEELYLYLWQLEERLRKVELRNQAFENLLERVKALKVR